MADSNLTDYTGTILENLPNASFRVKLDNASLVLCHLAGRMRRMRYMRFLPGDRVRVEIPNIDPTKGRIVAKIK